MPTSEKYKIGPRDNDKPGIEQVQALGDISRSALCCHSNETREPIANPPNNVQLEGTPYQSARDRQTERDTHRQL